MFALRYACGHQLYNYTKFIVVMAVFLTNTHAMQKELPIKHTSRDSAYAMLERVYLINPGQTLEGKDIGEGYNNCKGPHLSG